MQLEAVTRAFKPSRQQVDARKPFACDGPFINSNNTGKQNISDWRKRFEFTLLKRDMETLTILMSSKTRYSALLKIWIMIFGRH